MTLADAIASSANGGAVYLPAGVYQVTPQDWLGASNKRLKFYGDGWYSTILRPQAGVMFDNAQCGGHFQFCTFEHIGFEGVDPTTVQSYADIPLGSVAFKVTSSGYDQGFRFSQCRFGFFDTALEMAGTDTASEFKYFGCKFHHMRTALLSLSNPQSFNHEFFGCDVECMFGDGVVLNQGGAVKVYGGSWIFFSDVGQPTYVVRGVSSSGSGSLPVLFDGVRFELRGNSTNLASLADVNQFGVTFAHCNFEDQATQPKPDWVHVGGYSTLDFENCAFYEFNGQPVGFVATGVNPYGQAGLIEFDRCTVPVGIANQCTKASGWGVVRGSRLRPASVGANPPTWTPITVPDFVV